MPRVKELTDSDRLDSGLKSAQQEVLETGGLIAPTTIAEAVQLSQFETWAVGKKGAGRFVFLPEEPGAQVGTVEWRADHTDVHDLIGGNIHDQLTEQILRVVGPQGLLRLKAAQLQVRIGTHSREPYLALIPDGAVGQPRSPTIVVEAAYLVETEQQLLKSLDLWMSDACDCQVAIGVRVFGDARKTGGIPSMDAYLAQRGQPVKGPIHFGPNSACGRPGLAQYQLFLPLQQVFYGSKPPERLAYPLRIDLFNVQRDVCSAMDVIGTYLRNPYHVTVRNHQPH